MNAPAHIYSDRERERTADARKQPEPRRIYSAFELAFREALNTSEMEACKRFLWAHEAVMNAGNAQQAYDGTGVDGVAYGGKTLSDKVVDAAGYLRVARLRMGEQEREVFEYALLGDQSAQATAERYVPFLGQKAGRRKIIRMIREISKRLERLTIAEQNGKQT